MSAWDGWYVKPANIIDRICLGRDARWVIGNRWGQVRWDAPTREEALQALADFRLEEQARIEVGAMVLESPRLQAELRARLRAKGFPLPDDPPAPVLPTC